MVTNILKILTFTFSMIFNSCFAQEIWKEGFDIPGKGIWGNSAGLIQSDFSGITTWILDYTGIRLTDSGDYAKTVSTAGGRFEVCDIEGEVTWRSETIGISDYKNVGIHLSASETGSGNNGTLKYLKAFYIIDNGNPMPFDASPVCEGNWGAAFPDQKSLKGSELQIMVKLSNNYSSDKVILDEIVVSGEKGVNPRVPVFGLVINEIMADPYPVEGLPGAEYLELLNTLSHPVSSGNWILRINGTEKKIPDFTIQAGGFLVLCATGSLDSLKQYGNVINIPGFQGLLNNGALIEILDENRDLIDQIAYSETWYADPVKERGGWSLERIDPKRTCNQPGNWKASADLKGGTPVSANSVYMTNPDIEPPSVKWAVAVAENQVEVQFSENMDTTGLNPGNFHLKEAGSPDSVRHISAGTIVLTFDFPLLKNKTYLLQFTDLTDECGNKLISNDAAIQWNTLDQGDVLISEVLFNPFPDGEDYVELYNNSQKLILLKNLSLATRDDSLKLKQVYPLAKNKSVLQPGAYLVLTKDTDKVFPFYRIKCPECFLQTEKFPTYINEGGRVVLADHKLVVVDEFAYSEKMHSPFLYNHDGVSLERSSFIAKTNETGNWHSASTGSGYGTPGYKNSQAEPENTSRPLVTFEPEAFSPDNDGYNDEYLIRYQMDRQGYIANVRVFDQSGRFVTLLAKNEILATEGTIAWNGKDETGKRLPIGMYVVLVEVFHESGVVHRFKDGVALTGRVE